MRGAAGTGSTESGHQDDLRTILNLESLRAIRPRGAVHIGAHRGQEVATYFDAGFERVLLIEANAEWCAFLSRTYAGDPRVTVLNYAICDREGLVDLLIHTSRTGSTEPASILPMKRFSEIVPTLHTAAVRAVEATTLDRVFERHDVPRGHFNFLNLDIQGAELLALAGAENSLPGFDVVVSEVSLIEMYAGGAQERDVVAFLDRRGFRKVFAQYHDLTENGVTFPAWGECVFVRTPGGT